MNKTAVIKHSIRINGEKTSVSMENAFWHGLHEIAQHKNTTVPDLIERIARDRKTSNLSSAIRIFVFNYVRSRVAKGKLGKGKQKTSWRNTANGYRELRPGR